MIVALPTPFPGELLYSLFARYRDRMQYASKRSIVQESVRLWKRHRKRMASQPP